MKQILLAVVASVCLLCACEQKPDASATLYTTDNNQKVGQVSFTDTKDGLLVRVDLTGLSAGQHGFHIHENPDCSATDAGHAMAAGGHYDPAKTGMHLGPNADGHKGDLPYLTVEQDGHVKTSFTLKGIRASEFKNRSVMIHAGGDNYSDTPAPLGGGGARIACGLVE